MAQLTERQKIVLEMERRLLEAERRRAHVGKTDAEITFHNRLSTLFSLMQRAHNWFTSEDVTAEVTELVDEMRQMEMNVEVRRITEAAEMVKALANGGE